MRNPRARYRSCNLDRNVECRERPSEIAAKRERQRHSRIEVGAGYRTEYEYHDHQDRAGRYRIAEKRNRLVPARQFCGHDARAHDGREQEGRSECLGNGTP